MKNAIVVQLVLGCLYCFYVTAGAPAETDDLTFESYRGGGEVISARCGDSEVFKDCESLTCGELKCSDPEPKTDCSQDCVYQCFCAQGFYRNSEGVCVTRNKCS